MHSRLSIFFIFCSLMIASPLGAQWSPPVDLFTVPSSTTTNPRVAVDANGNATAVWEYTNGSTSSIQASYKPFGGNWQAIPDTLSLSNQEAFSPRIVVDANGNATAVWAVYNGSNFNVQSSYKPFGGSWQPTPDTISVLGEDASNPEIAIDANGNVTAIWQGFSLGFNNIKSSYKPFGGSWQSIPDIIVQSTAQFLDHQIYIDLNGNASTVWVLYDGAITQTNAIQASFNVGGSWTPFDTIYTASTNSFFLNSPQIVVDSNNNATVVWESLDWNTLQSTIQSSYKPASSAWEPVITISSATQDSNTPFIVVDANGNVTAIWDSFDNNTFISSIQSSFKPFNGSWQPSFPISDVNVESFSPQMAIDPNGNITAVWITYGAPPLYMGLQSSYKPSGGSWRSPETILQLTQEFPLLENQSIAVDANGNAIVVWDSVSEGEIFPTIVQSSTYTHQQTKPLPPCKFRGCLHWKKYVHKRHYHLKAKWTPSSSPNIKKYRIYKHSKVVHVVKPNKKLKFKTHLFWRSSTRKFKITAVNTNNVESARKKLKICCS